MKCPKCGSDKQLNELAPDYYQCLEDDCFECFEPSKQNIISKSEDGDEQ